MQHQMADSGARILVMLDNFYPVVRAVRANTQLEHIILTSPADFLPPVLHTLYPLSQRNVKHPEPPLTAKERHEDKTLHAMSAMGDLRTRKGIEVFNLPVQASGNELAVLQYTGGTTGLSKGAMLTHRNLLANAMQTRYWTPNARVAEEVTLCVTPFFHSYGLTVGMNLSILAAATMVLLPLFKAKDVVKTISRYRPTLMPGIPTMYLAIMREAGERTKQLSSIKDCISGAAPLPAKVRIDFETITHGKLVEGYGLSEAGPVTYWNREEETANIFVNGWMRTGDIGKMDEDGYFYVLDRAKDMIIASGFNVYPREVEEILFLHPSVQEAAVIGVPDEYRGETVAAFVILKPGIEASEATRQDILSYCKHNLTPYKVPKILEFRQSLPKSLIGKVLRRELKVQNKTLN